MRRTDKEQYVQELSAKIKESEAVFLADFKGLTFPQISSVREGVKGTGNDFRVVKNTLIKIALHENEITEIDDLLAGQTVCAIVRGDVAAAAKQLKNYSKEFDKFQIKGGYLNGSVLSAADVSTLADLPSREVLLSRALASMNAPVSNFVSLLANVPRSFLNVLNAIKDNKES